MREKSNRRWGRVGISPSERIRLMAMVVLLVLVAGVFFKVVRNLPGQQGEGTDVPREPERPMKVERYDVDADLPPELLDQIHDRTTEQRAVWDQEPYRALLEAAGRMIDDDERFGDFEKVPAEVLRENPDAYRGRAIQVQGELLDVREHIGEDIIEYRGHLRDDDGVVWTFSTRRKVPTVEPGQRAWIKGFFYKLFWDTAPDDDTIYERSPYIVGRTLQRGYPPIEPVDELDPSLFAAVREDSDPDTLVDHSRFLEPVPYQGLLSYVKQLTPEEKKAIEWQEIEGLELLREPNEYRGEPVELFGRLEYLRQVYDPIPVIDQDYLYRGLLVNTKRKPEYIVFLDRPPAREGDLVTIRGFFFKKYGYDTQGRTEQAAFNIAPLIVAVETERFVTPEDESISYITAAVAIAAIIITGLFIYFGLRERARSKKLRDEYVEKKRARRGEAVPSEPPAKT